MEQYLAKQVRLNTETIANLALKGMPILSGTTSGTSSAYTISIVNGPTITDGLLLLVDFHVSNNASATLNYNESGARPLKIKGEFVADDIIFSDIYLVQYSEGSWNIVNSGGSGNENTYGITTGVNNNYNVSIDEAPQLKTGITLNLLIHEANTGPSTLNFNNNGARLLKIADLNLAPGALKANMIITVVYDGSDWEIISSGGSGSSGGGSGISYGTTTGTSSAYEVNIPTGPALEAGIALLLFIHETNVDSPTLNYNNSGARDIKYANEPILAKSLNKDAVMIVVYDGVDWEIVSSEGKTINTVVGVVNKYFTTNPTNGASRISYIGGTVDSYDPQTDEFRFLINGVEQIPGVQYTIDTVAQEVILIGFTANSADDYTFIVSKFESVEGVPTNVTDIIDDIETDISEIESQLAGIPDNLTETLTGLSDEIADTKTELNQSINNVATSIEILLNTSAWVVSGGFNKITINNSMIKATSTIIVALGSSNTEAQNEEMVKAGVKGESQATGSLVLVASKQKPAANIYVSLIILN